MIETSRLILRQWQEEDRLPFAKMNADAQVMEFFPSRLSREQSDAMFDKIVGLISQQGWGFWALEEKASRQFLGFVGLNSPKESLPCSPCVEVGWRLLPEFWGRGFAPEAASRCLEYAFEQLEQEEVVSFTALDNLRSQRVMRKLGMHDSGKNFMHPDIDENSLLREHVLYVVSRQCWKGEK